MIFKDTWQFTKMRIHQLLLLLGSSLPLCWVLPWLLGSPFRPPSPQPAKLVFSASVETRTLGTEKWEACPVHQVQPGGHSSGEDPGVQGGKGGRAGSGRVVNKEGRQQKLLLGDSCREGLQPEPTGGLYPAKHPGQGAFRQRGETQWNFFYCRNNISLSYMNINESLLCLQGLMCLHLVFSLRPSMPGTSRQSVTISWMEELQPSWCSGPDISVQLPSHI